MRNMRDIWSIVHDWNANRKHRHCLVAVPHNGDLDAHALAIDFVWAASWGQLRTFDEATGKVKVIINATQEPPVIGPYRKEPSHV
jgi:hypothetical protein